MHKSSGNMIEFNEAADKMGVDVMRWLYCAHKPENNLLLWLPSRRRDAPPVPAAALECVQLFRAATPGWMAGSRRRRVRPATARGRSARTATARWIAGSWRAEPGRRRVTRR